MKTHVLLATALLLVPIGAEAKRRGHRTPVMTGFQVPAAQLRGEPMPRPSGDLVLESVNFAGERVSVNLYDGDGSFNEESLEKLYHFFRCRRTGTEKPIDARLFEVLSIIHDRFQRPIQLISGFRNQEHMTSYHFHGSASDIRIEGVDDKVLHAFVASLDNGNMGLGRYPRGHFIHVDVRPEASYRWIDRSPPGGGPARHKKPSKHRNA